MTGAKAQRRKKQLKNNNNNNNNKQTNKKKSLRYSEGTPVRIKKSGMPFVKLPAPANFVKTAHSHSIRQQAFVLDISEFKALTGNQS